MCHPEEGSEAEPVLTLRKPVLSLPKDGDPFSSWQPLPCRFTLRQTQAETPRNDRNRTGERNTAPSPLPEADSDNPARTHRPLRKRGPAASGKVAPPPTYTGIVRFV